MDTARQIMQGSGQGLIEFLDSKGERGDIKKATATAFRIAAGKILSVESEELAAIDIRKLDVPDLLERFVNLHRGDYGDGSLETYKSRFRRSVAMYIGWLDGDANWKNAGLTAAGSKQASRQTARRPSARKQTPKTQDTDAAEAADARTVDRDSASDPAVRLMTYDVPLRPDLIVSVTLPLDLTAEDAERFANFIRVLAFSSSRPGSESGNTTQGGA